VKPKFPVLIKLLVAVVCIVDGIVDCNVKKVDKYVKGYVLITPELIHRVIGTVDTNSLVFESIAFKSDVVVLLFSNLRVLKTSDLNVDVSSTPRVL
jgi:hypothetical protein